MANVLLKNIKKVYENGFEAVKSISVDIKDKEFVVLLGPSGCGKTTTLRMLAGLEEISDGELMIDDKKVNDVLPKDRNIAMVFQNYALYPHMTVFDNMAFGLKLRKTPKGEIEERVNSAAKILKLESLLDRKPKQLSGGQRQRVALGRAIVRKPKVFLFDEPLSNLDAKLRGHMRAELADLHRRLNTTMVYVTHDQVEAMTLGDKIIIMKDGEIQQVGTPLDLYDTPVNKFVAGFIGSPPMNIFDVSVKSSNDFIELTSKDMKLVLPKSKVAILKEYDGKEVVFGIRPENISKSKNSNADNFIKGVVSVIENLGAETFVYIENNIKVKANDEEAGEFIIVKLSRDYDIKVNDTITFTFDADYIHIFDKNSGISLL